MTHRPPRSLVVSVAIAAVLLAVAIWSRDSVAVDDLEVVETQELDLPFGDAYLAPNGERIATYAEGELCVYGADGERQRCVDEELRLDANSIRWDPGGTRLVFTENFYEYFEEPDLWLLDAVSGDLTNLTDDGVDPGDGRSMLTSDSDEAATADLDLLPSWVDDSTIRFLRWHRSDDDENSTVEVLEIPADGGDPESIGTLATATAPAGIAYAQDDRAAYDRIDEEDVVLADLAGEDAESIADDTQYTVAVSAGGDEVLVAPMAGAYLSPEDAPPAKVVPVDGGEATEIDAPLRWVTWRTGGNGLAYATYDVREDPLQVTIELAADPGGDGREIETGQYFPPYREAGLRSPVWSTQDTILLMRETDSDDDSEGDEQPFQYVLVHLGED